MSEINLGFYRLVLFACGYNSRVRLYSAKGKSFVGNADASGATYSEFTSIDEAIEAARERGRYIWEHNDRLYLIEEYGLSRNFVNEFLRYTWPKEAA